MRYGGWAAENVVIMNVHVSTNMIGTMMTRRVFLLDKIENSPRRNLFVGYIGFFIRHEAILVPLVGYYPVRKKELVTR